MLSTWRESTLHTDLLWDIGASIVSGVILAILFFVAKEKIFALWNITGRWYFEITTDKTAYNPYQGMILRYTAILGREGNSIAGTVEKIYEKSSTGERAYTGENRTRGIIEGYYEKRYVLSKDRIYLHVTEEGHGREFTHFYTLTMERDGLMMGTFVATAGDQEGTARWQRKPFSD